MRSVVVFPQPEGPMMARNSPSPISKLVGFTAVNSAKRFSTLSKTTNGFVMLKRPSCGPAT